MGNLGCPVHITVKWFHLWKDCDSINLCPTGVFPWIAQSNDLVLSRHVVFWELQRVLWNACGWRRTCISDAGQSHSPQALPTMHHCSRGESLPALWYTSIFFTGGIIFFLIPTNYSSHYLFFTPKWKFHFILFYSPALCWCIYLKLSSWEVVAECCG